MEFKTIDVISMIVYYDNVKVHLMILSDVFLEIMVMLGLCVNDFFIACVVSNLGMFDNIDKIIG